MRLADIEITCFTDLADLAFRLREQQRLPFQAALLLDPTGRTLDLLLHEGRGDGLAPIMAEVDHVLDRDDRVEEVILVSSTADALALSSGDRFDFGLAARCLSGKGATLLDWVQTDGVHVCSVAEAEGHRPWPDGGR